MTHRKADTLRTRRPPDRARRQGHGVMFRRTAPTGKPRAARADTVPRYLAIHEAGHAVVSWALQRELYPDSPFPRFYRITVRTPAEFRAQVDWKGREVACQGLVEGSDRYMPLGKEFVRAVRRLGREGAGRLKAMRANMLADVTDVLAGPMAEARYRRCSQLVAFLMGGDGDMKIAKLKAGDWSRNDEERSSIINACGKRAAALVRANWPAILRLADALVERRVIEADDAVAIIEDC